MTKKIKLGQIWKLTFFNPALKKEETIYGVVTDIAHDAYIPEDSMCELSDVINFDHKTREYLDILEDHEDWELISTPGENNVWQC